MLKVLTASAVLFACAANAGECWDKRQLETKLRTVRGEYLQMAMPTSAGLLQYFLDAKDGSWSLTLTKDGRSCIVALGSLGEAL